MTGYLRTQLIDFLCGYSISSSLFYFSSLFLFLESKGMRVNMNKTKVTISGEINLQNKNKYNTSLSLQFVL